MTNKIYLTKEKKKYYRDDFFENVLNETDTEWKLSETIKPFLIRLTESDGIQPIYSKFPELGLYTQNSYLQFAYSEELEETILGSLIPDIKEKFNNNDWECTCSQLQPKDNGNKIRPDSKLGCRNNPDYFRINHIDVDFEYQNRDIHIKFWTYITEQLIRLESGNKNCH